MELWLHVPSELTLLTEVVTVAMVNGPMLRRRRRKRRLRRLEAGLQKNRN